MDNRIGWGVSDTCDAVQEAMEEREALLRVVRAAEVVFNVAEYDLKHERPGYYIHSDDFHGLFEALEALPEGLINEDSQP